MRERERDGEGGRAMMGETMYKRCKHGRVAEGRAHSERERNGDWGGGGGSVAAGDGSGCERVRAL